jgi:nitrate/TMAO reductase-like tetraheme cytochrome c subunit
MGWREKMSAARWREWMSRISWRLVLTLLIGAVIGAGAVIASVQVNHATSTEKFCAYTCHSMTPKVTDPHYLQSKHISNSKGVRPSCGDCHIPKTNWFLETYTHVRKGLHDLIAEKTTNFSDQKAWEARRVALAKGVHDDMRAWDNAPCKGCHVVASIKPSSPAGQAVHTALPAGVACVDCHQALVHSPPGAQPPK